MNARSVMPSAIVSFDQFPYPIELVHGTLRDTATVEKRWLPPSFLICDF